MLQQVPVHTSNAHSDSTPVCWYCSLYWFNQNSLFIVYLHACELESCTVMRTTVIPRQIHRNGSEMCGDTTVTGMTIAELPRKWWLPSAVIQPSWILLTYQLHSTLCCCTWTGNWYEGKEEGRKKEERCHTIASFFQLPSKVFVPHYSIVCLQVVKQLQCVSKKNTPDIFSCNLNKYFPISIIFSTSIT